jgi:hypothetical protein
MASQRIHPFSRIRLSDKTSRLGPAMLTKMTDAGWEKVLRVFAVSDKQHGDNTLTLLSNPANASVDHFHCTDPSTTQMNVRCWGQTGTHLLLLYRV